MACDRLMKYVSTGLFKLFLDSADGDKKAAAPGAITGLHPALVQGHHTLTAYSGAPRSVTETSVVFLPSLRVRYYKQNPNHTTEHLLSSARYVADGV